MDIAYTYSTPTRGLKVTVYAPPGVDVPTSFQVRLPTTGEVVTMLRLSDRELTCGTVARIPGECTSFECHRRVLGDCQCGRHQAPIEFRAVNNGR